jgi:hypothetical protein
MHVDFYDKNKCFNGSRINKLQIKFLKKIATCTSCLKKCIKFLQDFV